MQQRGRVGLREVSSCARLERIDIVAHPSIQPPSRLSMAPVLASVVVVARCASRSVVRAIAVHRREVEARLRSWRRGRVAMGHWRRREIVRDHLVQSVRSSTRETGRELRRRTIQVACCTPIYGIMQPRAKDANAGLDPSWFQRPLRRPPRRCSTMSRRSASRVTTPCNLHPKKHFCPAVVPA